MKDSRHQTETLEATGTFADSTAQPCHVANPLKRSRYRGCLLGGAVGDALGAVVEFLSADEIVSRFGPSGISNYASAYGRCGAITDDTQMTLFTAEGLLRGFVRGSLRGIGPVYPTVIAHAYLRWLKTQGHVSPLLRADAPPGILLGHAELFSKRAPGATCISALRAMQRMDERADNDSKGCGGVMRVAPVGMFTANWLLQDHDNAANVTSTFELGCKTAAITHGHPTGQLASGVLAVMVGLLLIGTDLETATERAKKELRKYPSHEETLEAIKNAQRLAATAPRSRDTLAQLGKGWVAEEALAIGLYSALAAPTFEQAIILAVNHDGDSDSTGSIAGNLLGASLGEAAIPNRWLADLELRPLIETIADDLSTFRKWSLDQAMDAETEFYWNRYPGG